MVVPDQRNERQPLSMPVYQPAETLSTTTRHLCCAPYVDVTFANTVIREVVESERKAVPPSYGFDIDPVVRHCLRARRLLIVRYAAVTVLLLAGLCISPAVTILWLGACAVAIGTRSPAWRALPRNTRAAIMVAIALIVVVVLGYQIFQSTINGYSSGYSDPEFGNLVDAEAQGIRTFAPVLLAVAMVVAIFLSRRQAYGIITTELAPGAPASAPRTGSSRVEWRLNAVAAMQRGNIAVHDIDPYAGAGWIEHGWSFVVPLVPKGEDDDDHVARRRFRIRLDAGALNREVERAVLSLRDPSLSDGERIPSLFVVPYVAADGHRRADDPLIDGNTRTPRTMASPETLTAIQNCPQGGLRHYLRAVVPVDGKEIRTWDGHLVLPASDSGIGVTAFVHLALEGGMLYTEFVATVMPQIRPLYKLGDNLRPERVPGRAILDTLRHFLRDNAMGPVHLVQIGWDAARLQSRMDRAGRAADEYRSYDYGARFSVRELAAELPTVKFMQRLDAAKYVSLLDRAVSESILNFLDEHGVDTDEFRSAVTKVVNDYSSNNIIGNISGGQVAQGNGNKLNQRNTTNQKGGEQRA